MDFEYFVEKYYAINGKTYYHLTCKNYKIYRYHLEKFKYEQPWINLNFAYGEWCQLLTEFRAEKNLIGTMIFENIEDAEKCLDYVNSLIVMNKLTK